MVMSGNNCQLSFCKSVAKLREILMELQINDDEGQQVPAGALQPQLLQQTKLSQSQIFTALVYCCSPHVWTDRCCVHRSMIGLPLLRQGVLVQSLRLFSSASDIVALVLSFPAKAASPIYSHLISETDLQDSILRKLIQIFPRNDKELYYLVLHLYRILELWSNIPPATIIDILAWISKAQLTEFNDDKWRFLSLARMSKLKTDASDLNPQHDKGCCFSEEDAMADKTSEQDEISEDRRMRNSIRKHLQRLTEMLNFRINDNTDNLLVQNMITESTDSLLDEYLKYQECSPEAFSDKPDNRLIEILHRIELRLEGLRIYSEKLQENTTLPCLIEKLHGELGSAIRQMEELEIVKLAKLQLHIDRLLIKQTDNQAIVNSLSYVISHLHTWLSYNSTTKLLRSCWKLLPFNMAAIVQLSKFTETNASLEQWLVDAILNCGNEQVLASAFLSTLCLPSMTSQFNAKLFSTLNKITPSQSNSNGSCSDGEKHAILLAVLRSINKDKVDQTFKIHIEKSSHLLHDTLVQVRNQMMTLSDPGSLPGPGAVANLEDNNECDVQAKIAVQLCPENQPACTGVPSKNQTQHLTDAVPSTTSTDQMPAIEDTFCESETSYEVILPVQDNKDPSNTSPEETVASVQSDNTNEPISEGDIDINDVVHNSPTEELTAYDILSTIDVETTDARTIIAAMRKLKTLPVERLVECPGLAALLLSLMSWYTRTESTEYTRTTEEAPSERAVLLHAILEILQPNEISQSVQDILEKTDAFGMSQLSLQLLVNNDVIDGRHRLVSRAKVQQILSSTIPKDALAKYAELMRLF